MPGEAASPIAPRVERRLAAILAADVVGYSRLMGSDEVGTLTRLKAYRQELAEPVIARHHGHIVKLMGDGLLVEFASVVDAVGAAIEIQRGIGEREIDKPVTKRIALRIGINLGDVIVEPDDIYGDGINVAARLEALAEPGGICVSDLVRQSVEGKLDVTFEEMGEQRLKNIARPVKAYRLRAAGLAAPAVGPGARRGVWLAMALAAAIVGAGGIAGHLLWPKPAPPLVVEVAPPPTPPRAGLALPDKPSIVVLPFTNMSADPTQDYFADGMSENLTTSLSKLPKLFVIARNSAFAYKGRSVNVQEVGKELGVRWVLEGSVQKAGDRVRIHAQLIDTTSGFHRWAERFDRKLEDIFALQDEVALDIVKALQIERFSAEDRQRLAKRFTTSLAAYDHYLHGREAYWRGTVEGQDEARRAFEQALRLDPRFALAQGGLAFTYVGEAVRAPRAPSLDFEHALESAGRAIALDETLPQPHVAMSLAQTYGRQFGEGIASARRAIALDPNYADGYVMLADALVADGRPAEALEALAVAMRLNPHFGMAYNINAAEANFHLGRYEEAIATAQGTLRRNPTWERARVVLAAAYGVLGRRAEGQWEVDELLLQSPEITLDDVRYAFPRREPRDIEAIIDGLVKAGFPTSQ